MPVRHNGMRHRDHPGHRPCARPTDPVHPRGHAGGAIMTTTASLLEIRDLTVEYHRGHRKPPLTALRDACLTVAAAETVALVGESGSGKSTLGNAILGLVPAASGAITFDGEGITHATQRRRRALTKQIQVVF